MPSKVVVTAAVGRVVCCTTVYINSVDMHIVNICMDMLALSQQSRSHI